MNRELVRSIGSCGVDNLIAKLDPAAATFGVYLAAGAGKLKRGSVLALVSGTNTYALMGATVSGTESQSFSGDGATRTFTVTAKPASLLSVKVGDTTMSAPADYSYNSGSGVITFVSSKSESQSFSGDGTSTTVTVTAKPASLTSVKVGDSTLTVSTDYSYNSSTGVITFTSAPASGTNNITATYSVSEAAPASGTNNITASYAVSVSANTPSCILADDADASGDSAVAAVAYRSGNFNRAAVHCAVTGEGDAAEEYVLTAADEDALRKYDIIFTDMMD